MNMIINRTGTARRAPLAASPAALIVVALAVVMALLALPVSVPVGPMYWDVLIYYDAANRIFGGQVPSIDFFAPVGPLGYYLFAGWLSVFPNGQPVLLAHWSLLAVTAPLMALVVADVGQRGRITAFALLVPFLIFALLPFNTREFYPFPGSDGFGIYNRQCCQLLYVLVAAIAFMRSQKLLATIVCATMLALFFLKITGFIAAMMICGFGFASGRLHLRPTVVAAGVFFLVLAALELSLGLVSHYIGDILLLVEKNSETLAPRFLQAASHSFGIIAPGIALAALSLYAGRHRLADAAAAIRARPGPTTVSRFLDQDAFWLGVVLFAGIFFETQNTGSQALIFVWPVVFAILLRSGKLLASPKILVATLALSGAAVLPVVVNTVERAARTYLGSVKNLPVERENLKTLGNLTMRGNVRDRVEHLLRFYADHVDLYDDLAAASELPSPILYSDYDFQVIHLTAIDRAVASIAALEAARGVRFETIMSLNFVNPFPWLMDRRAPLHIAIGADPMRAVPDPSAETIRAVEETDLVLLPRCPPTTANRHLLEIYQPALAAHTRIRLNACFDAFVSPRLAAQVAN